MRDSTKCMPSSAISSPAAQPRTVERNIRRAIRMMIRIDRMPTMAAEIRQPNEL